MATKMKASDTDWLASAADGYGVHVQCWAHGHDDRWIEVLVYDHDAPKQRKWMVQIIDRETGRVETMRGEAKFATVRAVKQQIGMPLTTSEKLAEAA